MRRDAAVSVPPAVVLYEDRPQDLVGLQLAVASLLRHSPGVDVLVSAPGAPDRLLEWFASRPGVQVVPADDLVGRGWNIKPELLRRHLQAGRESVCWLDADMIVGGDLGAALVQRSPGHLLLTDDFWYARERDSLSRTLAWGLPPGRAPRGAVNTGLVRVDRGHLPLLAAWQELLDDPRYRAAQAAPYAQRPLHLLGDQEVLSALLGAREWQDLPVAFLRRGRDVAQCFGSAGFSPRERVAARAPSRRPLLVHAMGPKPWRSLGAPPGPGSAARRERTHMALSPYTALAAGYADEVGTDEMAWATPGLHDGLLTRWGTHLDPVLRELPLAVPQAALWQTRRWAGRARRRLRALVG